MHQKPGFTFFFPHLTFTHAYAYVKDKLMLIHET